MVLVGDFNGDCNTLKNKKMKDKILFTKNGFIKFEEKIEKVNSELKGLQEKMGDIVADAGDCWHDNASYDSQQLDILRENNRLRELNKIKSEAIIIEEPRNCTFVHIGHIIVVDFNGVEKKWEIVGFNESNVKEGKVAYNTPIGSLLLKKKVGQIIKGTISNQKVVLKIISINLPKKK